MSYCSQCGAYIPVDETVCPACGYDPEAEKKKSEYSYGGSAGAAAQQQYTDTAKEPWEQEKKAKEPWEEKKSVERWEPWAQSNSRSSGASQTQAQTPEEQEKRLSVLSYVGPLFLLPLLLHKDDPFTRFHANQGLVLFLLEVLVCTVFDGLAWLAGMGFCLYCLVRGAKNVAEGKEDRLPYIGGVNLIK